MAKVIINIAAFLPLDNKEIQPVNPKGNQPWIFISRTDAGADTPVLWPSDAKSWLTGKDPNARKNWGQEKKSMRRLDGIMDSMDMSLSKWKTGKPSMLQSVGSQRVGHNWLNEQQFLP